MKPADLVIKLDTAAGDAGPGHTEAGPDRERQQPRYSGGGGGRLHQDSPQ